MSEKSPFAPAKIEELPALAGIRMATAATSMRYKNRDDLLLIECAKNTHVAGVFTTSQTAGACVHWGRVALKNGGGRARLLIVELSGGGSFPLCYRNYWPAFAGKSHHRRFARFKNQTHQSSLGKGRARNQHHRYLPKNGDALIQS
jgi:ribosomal protein S27E